MRIYGPAFRTAVSQLEDAGHLEPRDYTDKEISHWLGYTVEEMWTSFAPHLPESVWRPASKVVGAEMRKLEQAGVGSMFPHVAETLSILVDCGWRMVFLSNCARRYCDFYRDFYGLDNWFCDYLCAGDYEGLTKSQIYALKHTNKAYPQPHIMIGDRHHDMEVAKNAHIPFVGCGYGYAAEGELEGADAIICTIVDLPDVLEGLV